MPLVSVIVPAYNRAHTIERALDSVFAQSVQDFEIIVVDDASTDNTVEVVRGYDDQRVKILRHDTNRFAGAARNTGMEAASGTYIAFLDSDDAWLPDKLELQINRLEGPDKDCDCSYTGALINLEGGLTKTRTYKPTVSGDALRPYLLNSFIIWTPTFLFRSSVLQDTKPFDPQLIRGEDVDFYLRILQQHRISCVSEPTVELFLDLNKQLAELSEQCDRDFLKRHEGLIKQQGKFLERLVYARYELRIADRYLQEGNLRKGLRSAGRAVLWNPFLAPKRYAATLLRIMRTLVR